LSLGSDPSSGDFEAAQGDVVGSDIEAAGHHTGAFAYQADGFIYCDPLRVGSAICLTYNPGIRRIDTLRLDTFPRRNDNRCYRCCRC
jgi:hypothetical protein